MSLLSISHFAISSTLGHGQASHWQALRNGCSGLRQLRFDHCDLDCYIGEVAGLEQPLPAALNAFDCRNHRLAWLTLQQDSFMQAVNQLREHHGTARIGVFIGTSTAGIHSAELAYRDMCKNNAANLPDWFDYRHTQNLFSAAEFVAQALQLSGPALCISTACSSSAKVFAAAYRSMQLGLCDAAIVGGVDSLCLTTLYGFNSLQLISAEQCRPADAQRNGISIGEAAGFAIVEKPDSSAPFNLLGYGESGDAHHMSSPDPQGRGAAMAMQRALRRANLHTSDIDYINLHGTGTPANDAAEDQGVVTLFGNQIPCSSTKGWTGHTLGAAGILEAAITMLCIEHGFMPQSLNTLQKDAALQANILMQSRYQPVTRVLSNSFGFGGSNCSLLLGGAQ
ncbi:MAG: beta-ketoacyl-[acyl-carrier-protein] synthase family protein [Steroidobacteraceae bacterium]